MRGLLREKQRVIRKPPECEEGSDQTQPPRGELCTAIPPKHHQNGAGEGLLLQKIRQVIQEQVVGRVSFVSPLSVFKIISFLFDTPVASLHPFYQLYHLQ